jgi:hypothetical protein
VVLSIETVRKCLNQSSRELANIRHVDRPSESSNPSKVMVPANTSFASDSHSSYNVTQNTTLDNILWETVVTREEIERHLLHYNRDSFRAAAASLCGHGIIHDTLTFSSLSPASEALLAGILPPDWYNQDNYLREILASFVITPLVKHYTGIPSVISEDDVLRGFNGWKERMSTSPSGRHLGHYEAII